MSTPADNPLDQSVQFLPGGGPQRAELLERLSIRTVEDLLWRLPRDLLDLTEVRQPQQLVEDELQTVRGVVVETESRQLSNGRTLTASLIDCRTDYVRGLFFNQLWMRQKLQPGHNVLFSGTPKRKQGRWEFSHPRIRQRIARWTAAEVSSDRGDLAGRNAQAHAQRR
jgi:ATP-dependent DNA helicase RecG